jgi:hypothetical protein
MKRMRCKPADPAAAIPMPSRGSLMPADGANVDAAAPYYARMLADGDIVEVTPEKPRPDRRRRNRKKG